MVFVVVVTIYSNYVHMIRQKTKYANRLVFFLEQDFLFFFLLFLVLASELKNSFCFASLVLPCSLLSFFKKKLLSTVVEYYRVLEWFRA